MQPLSAYTSIPSTRKRTGKILSPWSYKMASLELFCNLIPDEKRKSKYKWLREEALNHILKDFPSLNLLHYFQPFYQKKKKKLKGNMIYYLFKGINKKKCMLFHLSFINNLKNYDCDRMAAIVVSINFPCQYPVTHVVLLTPPSDYFYRPPTHKKS